MVKKVFVGAAAIALTTAIGCTSRSATLPETSQPATAGQPSLTGQPSFDPAHFVDVIDNPYYPLPVGRTLVYRGTKDGQSQIDRVTVLSDTKVIEGISATVVHDVATHHGTKLEETFDWYAQDDQGNVWYLGEDTKAFLPNGKVDTSGSWETGVDGAVPGIIMEAHPQFLDAYRQEYLKGEAEDTAWIVDLGASATIPYGKVDHAIRSLETTRLEPDVIDEKVYAPGLGIVLERALAGDTEVAKLVKVVG